MTTGKTIALTRRTFVGKVQMNRKMVPMNLFAKQIDTDVENKRGCPGGNWGSGMNWETGVDMYTLLTLCIKQIMNMNLLYGSGNPTWCSVVT